MSKRPQQKGAGKGGDASKKVKSNAPDIPSSNFAAARSKPPPKHSHITQEQISSVPKLRQNIKDPTRAIRNMALPDDISNAMGPDVSQLLKYEKEKKKKEEIKARIEKSKPPQEREKKIEKMTEEEEYKPKTITQDESGRMIDEEGNVIHQKLSQKSSLIVNKNKDKEDKVKKMLSLQRGTNRTSKFYDPTLVSRSQSLRNRRMNNAFHFIDKGSIIKKGEALRGHTETSVGSLDTSKMSTENDTMAKLEQKLASSEIQIGIKRTGVRVKRHDPIPDVEWWDAPLLVPTRRSYLPEEYLVLEKESMKEKYDGDKKMEEVPNNSEQKPDGETNQASLIERLNRNLELLMGSYSLDNVIAKEKINNLVEHPATFKIDGANQNIVIPTYLTKDERKKMRRKKRLEKEKDKQEKIRLGLMKPPPPKVKYSNFMNIMKDEAVADPTRVDKEVREAIEARLKAHLDRNAKKKLTKDQKADKYMRKLKRDSAQECRVAVFRIEDLSHGAHKFKVNMNAQQLALNGVCIIVDKRLKLNLPNVVVVEGGPKAIKFYKKLMLRRVRWNLRTAKEGAAAEGDGEQAGAFENKCTLVWEGISKDHSFNKWKVAEVKSEMEGRRLLSDRGVEFYWDRALTGAEVVDDQD